MKKINIFFLVVLFYFFNSFAFSQDDFLAWKNDFKILALSKGISEKTFDSVMKNVKFLPKVIEYDRYQPEFYEDTKTYISKRTSNKKVDKGIKFYHENNSLIKKIDFVKTMRILFPSHII